MDLVSKQTEEALGWAKESAKAVEDAPQVNTGLSFKDAATFVASATPIIGDAMAAKEVYDELNKEDPNYFLAGALGGAALVGLVPGLGDAAANAIRAGAKKAAETAKRIEVDPNALGSMGGNIRLKPKEQLDAEYDYDLTLKMEDMIDEWARGNVSNADLRKNLATLDIKLPYRIGPKADPSSLDIQMPDGTIYKGTGDVPSKPRVNQDVVEAERLLDDPAALKSWQEENKLPETKRQANPVDSQAAAQELFEGNITSKEARKKIADSIPEPKEFTAEEVMEMMPTVTEVTGSLGKKAGKFGILGVKGFGLEAGQKVSSRLDIPAYNNYDTWVVSIHDGTKDAGSVVGFGQAIRLKGIRFGSKSKEALDIARGKRRTPAGEDKPMGKSTIARVFGEYVPEDPYELQKQAADIIASGSDEWTQVGMNPYRGSAFYDKKTGMPVFEADEVIQVGPLVLAKNVKKPTISQMKEMAVKTADGKIRMFNEGGMAMDEQTRMAFALGGSVEDVDPVSGNEVPTGSLPEEVRDDIPAQLSEGEYVVPADVVRFYGVKFFEDLRTQAKQGFAEMEANGRIGGEPIQPEGMEMVEPEDEDFPFDISELQTVAVDQPMVNMKDGGYLKGYNEGGDVTTPVMPQQPVIPDVSAIFETNFMADNIEYREYRDPKTGTTFSLRFVNGKPDAAAQAMIDLGYVAAGESDTTPEITVEQPATGESTSVNPSRESNSFSEQEEKVKAAQNTFKEYEDWELFELAEKLGDPKINKAISGIGAFAGPVGLIASIGKRVTGFAVARELADRYKTAKTDADRAKIQKLFDGVTTRGKEREKGITGGGGLLGGGGILQDVDNSGEIDFGDTWLGDLLGFDVGGAGIQGPSQSDSWDGARRTGGTGSKANLDLGEHIDTDRDSAFAEYTAPTDRTSLAPTEKELGDTRPRARPTEQELDDTRPRARPTTDTSASTRDDNDSNRNVSGGSNVVGKTASGSNIYSAKSTGKKDAQGRTLYTF